MTQADKSADNAAHTDAIDTQDALTSVVRARDLFLDKTDAHRSALLGVVSTGIAAHDREMTRIQSELEKTGALSPQAVSAYITSVQDSTIDPLQFALKKLDLVASVASAWDEANSSIGAGLYRMSGKGRLELSPHLQFVEGIANGVAELEFGIAAWVNEVLDAASAMDWLNGVVHESNTEQDVTGEDPVQDRFVAAGIELGQRLRAANDCLGTLQADIEQNVEAAAQKKLSELEKALGVPENGETVAASCVEDLVDCIPWFEQVESRMVLTSARWTLFRAAVQMQASFLQRVHEECLAEWYSTNQLASKAMVQARDTAEAVFGELEKSGHTRDAIRGLVDLLRSTTNLLDSEVSSQLDTGRAIESIGIVAVSAIGDLASVVEALPGTLTVHSTQATADIRSTASTREVDLRAAASAVVDETLIPGSSAWSESIHERLGAVSDEANNLQSVLQFYVGGAIEELRDVSGKRTPAELRNNAEAAARELTISGLDRVIEVLAKLEQDLLTSTDGSASVIAELRQSFWGNVNSQVVAETAQAKLALQLETKAESARQAFRLQVSGIARQCMEYLSNGAARLYKKTKELLSLGHAAIVGDTDPVIYESTINALAELNTIRSRLPVVYRRLFSFHPLNDDSLMAGRDEDIRWLNRKLDARKHGRANAIVISGSPGCGVTSFINSARQTCLRRTLYCSIDLNSRITEESVLVEKLVAALGLGEIEEGEATLVNVADSIIALDESEKMRVCVIERMEHLFLRKIGGFELVAGMLRLMSETASRIVWIATTSDSAWQLLATNEPTALGLVSHYRISGYDRLEIEEVINQRHRRSALPIAFDPPANISPLLRRRIRRANTDDERQSIYRSAYFDDLFTTSGQNIMLAIFYWLLSVRYRPDIPDIQVRRLPELNFDSLANLSASELFALKAFLEHGSLTVSEYCQISNVDEIAGIEVLESLSNAMLVERARDEDAGIMDLDFERIERGGRYRVRPLLAQPIIRGLRAKNIVH